METDGNNFRNDPTKTLSPKWKRIGALALAFFILAMLPYSSLTYVANATDNSESTEDSACMDKIHEQVITLASGIDEEKATATVSREADVTSKFVNFDSEFGGTFGTWTYDLDSCTVEWKDANAVYYLKDPESKEYVKVVSVAMDPSLSKITEVSEYPAQFFFTTSTSSNWAGYQFYGNSGATKTILQSKATWTLPAASAPWTNACSFTHCDLAVWVGLSDTLGGSSGKLAQAGSNSGLYCTIGCSFFYYGFYELLPAPATKCTGLGMVPGDTMRAYVYNQAKTGGSSSKYAFVVEDLTRSTVCGAVNQSYSMTAPKYGTFIDERPFQNDCGCTSRLAKFTTSTQTSASIYYDGAERSISTPYANGWYDKVTMRNGSPAVTNISVGSVSSGSFTMTWQSSNNT